MVVLIEIGSRSIFDNNSSINVNYLVFLLHQLQGFAPSDHDLEKAVVHSLLTDTFTLVVGQIYSGQTDKFYELVPLLYLNYTAFEESILPGLIVDLTEIFQD